MRHCILIVDDDEIFLRPLQRTLEVAGYDVIVAPSGEDAMERLKRDDVDLVLTDKRLPGIDGVELVRRLKDEHAEVAAVVMTAYGTIGSAVEAMRLGAEDYLVKPFDAAEVLVVVRRAIEFQELKAASRASIRRNQERFTLAKVVAGSAAMREVFELLGSVAALDTTVLLYGETGVGKELLARSIHFSGARRDRPLVAVNCAAIPGELFEAELFGFRKGAFTGASETRRGRLQMAHKGTLLLDEIGEMPLPLQTKLLRVIEDRQVTPIGSDRVLGIDVRFIATTNKDLQAEVERGTFRRDLFYRLSVMPIRVPPLRERVSDIPRLAQHFLEASARRTKRPVGGFAPDALRALCRYAWPGNVRELENVIERAVIVSKSDTLADVERFLTGEGERPRIDLSLPFREAKTRVVEEFERSYFTGLLEAHGGTLAGAARQAGMDPKNLWEKLTRYNLRRPTHPDDPAADHG
jgi:DNA-binding NtrC family response regulator